MFSSYIANFNFNCRQESNRSAESAVIRIPWLSVSSMLQGSTLDVLEGHQMVSTVKSKDIATRNDDIEFDKVYGNMLGMAVFIPYLDCLIRQLDLRFSDLTIQGLRALCLIP